jgi:hypothetical protein
VKRERPNSENPGAAGDIYLGTRVKTVMRRSPISTKLSTVQIMEVARHYLGKSPGCQVNAARQAFAKRNILR